jgi:endonuclease G
MRTRAYTFAHAFSLGWIARYLFEDTSFFAAPATVAPHAVAPGVPAALSLSTGAVAHLRVSDAFVAEYDSSRRVPRWVAERLTRASTLAPPRADRSGEAFREEPALPPLLRARLAAYAGSGWDRGHLAPAADHRHSQAALSDTFFLSNVVPQCPDNNRHFWARLEKFTRDLLRDRWDTVYVVTGPLYLPARAGADAWAWRNPALGAPLQWVAVPTHLFKVIFARNEGGAGGADPVVGAFVVPNAPVPEDAPLRSFAVPLAAVEAAGGLRLLRGGVAEGEEAAAERSLGALPLENAARLLVGEDVPVAALPPQLLAAAAVPPPPLFTAAGGLPSAPPRRLRHVCETPAGCELPPPGFWAADQPSRATPRGRA